MQRRGVLYVRGKGGKKGERFRSLPVAGKFFLGFGDIVAHGLDDNNREISKKPIYQTARY